MWLCYKIDITMENKTPKFRLEDIAKIPGSISEMVKEIIAEISSNPQLRPALVHNEVCVPYVGPCATQSGEMLSDYSCDPFCACNTESDCPNHCNYCRCVDHCGCVDNNPCPDYETPWGGDW
jgi:hypothetical protein